MFCEANPLRSTRGLGDTQTPPKCTMRRLEECKGVVHKSLEGALEENNPEMKGVEIRQQKEGEGQAHTPRRGLPSKGPGPPSWGL